MTEKRLRFESTVVHPLLSVTTPSLFAITLHSLLRGSLGFPPSFPDLLSWLAPAASVLEAVAGNAARRERAALSWRLREIALYLLAAAALFITLGVPFAYLGYLAILILACWTLSFTMHAALRSREELLRSTEGKSGPELSRAMHQMLLLEGDAMVKLRNLRGASSILSGSLVLFASVLVLAGRTLRPVSAVLLVFQAVVGRLMAAELASLAGEQRLLAQNLRLSSSLREIRFSLGLVEIGAALALALGLARRAAPLSISELGRALERLGAALAERRPSIGPELWRLVARILAWIAALFPTLPTGTGGALGSPTFPQEEPSPFLQRLFYAAGMTLLALGIGSVLAFLFVPLTEAEFSQGISRKRPLRFLRHRMTLLLRIARNAALGVRRVILELVRRSRTLPRRENGLPALRLAARDLGAILFGVDSGRAAAEIRLVRTSRQRALRAFALLAAWSARRGYARRPCLGPLEFAREAGRRFPLQASVLESSAVLVERILYGRSAVGVRDLKVLERQVRGLRRLHLRGLTGTDAGSTRD